VRFPNGLTARTKEGRLQDRWFFFAPLTSTLKMRVSLRKKSETLRLPSAGASELVVEISASGDVTCEVEKLLSL